jgi:hypothetical protein
LCSFSSQRQNFSSTIEANRLQIDLARADNRLPNRREWRNLPVSVILMIYRRFAGWARPKRREADWSVTPSITIR